MVVDINKLVNDVLKTFFSSMFCVKRKYDVSMPYVKMMFKKAAYANRSEISPNCAGEK
jgi:hypothetical protein